MDTVETVKLSLFLVLLLVVTLILPVYAEEADIDLLQLPTDLGNSLGISTTTAGVILAVLLVAPFNICLLLGKKMGTIAIILNFVFLGFFTSIGWIPNWTILLVALIIAGLYAVKAKGVF